MAIPTEKKRTDKIIALEVIIPLLYWNSPLSILFGANRSETSSIQNIRS